MDFVISREELMKACKTADKLKAAALFYQEQEAFSGVNKIAGKVMHDIELVFGVAPLATTDRKQLAGHAVIYGTVGRSAVLDELNEKGFIDLSSIEGKREVYLFQVIDAPFEGVEKALVIAGSDKRGTIYGLFHLSEELGVSPLVDWCDVKPRRRIEVRLDGALKIVSKEPSVRFRGFFINDEWPAFGNWTMKNFGGFNAKMYDHVFELLLRLKGNYLWPAMWSSRFSDDGPGLASHELADEYGVIMGASHHEPCLRYGEEYKYLRGKDSIYGDAWNFRTNEEGITRFWADGLKRSGRFENVITVGMRGEADTAIMGREATLADNINLLRDVLRTQNRLIKEYVNPDLSKVPRMLALYKEVEPFYYGDKDTPGLMNCEELEDVIIMLCDDNHGNLRTLPTEEMLKHKGGFGMYYHFDYHGGPISYEWINSSYLPKIWEQMTMAYDFGIRELWIVNVGDICTQEFPLSFFLDLAYDFEKWGSNAINTTDDYTREWIDRQFDGVFDEEDKKKIFELITGYTRIAHKRRPETMRAGVYHPVNYKETDKTLQEIEYLLKTADELYAKLNNNYSNDNNEKKANEDLPAYFALVYYPVVGNLNLQKMQLLSGKNHYFAHFGYMEANKLAEQVKECMKRDKEIVEEYNNIDNGKWYGMGLSEHIGFTRWNEDECQNPILMYVIPANKPRLSVSVDGSEQRTEGSSWTFNKLFMLDFLEPDVTEASFTIYAISDKPAEYTISCDNKWLKCSKDSGTLDGINISSEQIKVTIDRSLQQGETEGKIIVKIPSGICTIIVKAGLPDISGLPEMTFINAKGYIAIEAEHFYRKQDFAADNGECSRFEVLKGYGKTLSAVKAFPTTAYFTPGKDAPYLEYLFKLDEAGSYELELYMQPSNPVTNENTLYYGIQLNDEEIMMVNAIPEGQRVDSPFWAMGVLNNIRRQATKINCKEGLNTLRIYAASPGFVLEKLVIYKEGAKPAESYLGPTESYYLGREKGSRE